MLEVDMVNDNFSIPDIIYEKLQKPANTSQPHCPHCKRIIKSEDIENWTLKITGQKGDRAFFSKPGSRPIIKVMGFKVSKTRKRKHRMTSGYLRVGHDEPTEF